MAFVRFSVISIPFPRFSVLAAVLKFPSIWVPITMCRRSTSVTLGSLAGGGGGEASKHEECEEDAEGHHQLRSLF